MHTAQFANSFSTGIAQIESVRENASRMFPFSVRWPVNTGFPGFSAKSAVIDGDMLGAAMHGCAVHSLATHHCGASHIALSLGFSPARRNPAAPPEAFPPASEATFSVANANSFSTDKPTEGPVAGRGISQGVSMVPKHFARTTCRRPEARCPRRLARPFAETLLTDLSTVCAQRIMTKPGTR